MINKAALIIVYNHRYDKNIPVIEKLYRERFSNIYHLVPFYDGNKSNVIPVYESSIYFEGYLAQGLKQYFKEEYEHYLFIGDDLILNPEINEDNYSEHFKLSGRASYIPEIFNLHDLTNNNTLRFLKINNIRGRRRKWYWNRIQDAMLYNHWKPGTETTNELPTAKVALKVLQKHGYDVQPLNYEDVYGGLFPLSFSTPEKVKQAYNYLRNIKWYLKRFEVSYPMVASYSDIVIVHKSSIKRFCHYCGVFASKELFVEFAIPTALLLACDKVVTEPEIGRCGDIYWVYTPYEKANYESQLQRYRYNINTLLSNFPAEKLYIHPIKLSQWIKQTDARPAETSQ